jgi:carboxyl-terminal processing protease
MKAVVIVVALFIILSLATNARSQGQQELKLIVDTAIAKAKLTSINATDVNWDSLSTAMHDAANGAKSVADLKRSFGIMMLTLKDRQAVFYQPTTKTILASTAAQTDANTNPSTFHFEILDNNVCYLRLVAIARGSSIQQQVAEVRQAIDSLAKGNAMQWIVDLRYATDGDHQSLLASCAPLLDEGLVATAVDNTGTIKTMYTVHNGNLYIDQIAITRFPLWTQDLRKAKIAILTSSNTRGAAELLTLGLKGRKNTKVFGQPTAGNNFGLTDVELTPNVSMRLAHLQYVDRKGNEYNDQITPDVKIDFTITGNDSQDRAIAEATTWLMGVQENAVALGMSK